MDIKDYVKSLRSFRVFHRWIGIPISLFVIISALTGVLLAWKKEVSVIQPPTQRGVMKDLSQWKPLNELADTALLVFQKKFPTTLTSIDRMDVRPSKGIVKVLLDQGWWEVQVDGHTGQVLSIARRHSDWIESVHDGSIVGDIFKLISMNALGFGLLIMTISGWWLWYGPKVIRRAKKNR